MKFCSPVLFRHLTVTHLGAMVTALSERQRRELEFYQEFSKLNDPQGISFDWISAQGAKPWNSYRRLIDIVKQRFSSEEQKLLDFGCGKGEFSIVLSKIGYEVFAFDISPNNISIAKRLASKYEMAERTHFQVGVAEVLDYPSDYFDVVVGTDILHHVEISQALSECSRVLKKGGIAIFHEQVRVPVFDTLRETRIGKWLVPREVSLEHHVTQDEKKLSADDLKLIKSFGLHSSIQQFLFLSRLERFFSSPKVSSFFEKVDFYLFKAVPPLKRLGGVAIIVLEK